jgi:hypothetical protein
MIRYEQIESPNNDQLIVIQELQNKNKELGYLF